MAERSSFFKKFNSEFEEQLSSSPNYQSAFRAASNSFEKRFGISPYSTWDSFKSQRSKRRKDK
jgi:hypothetical protein